MSISGRQEQSKQRNLAFGRRSTPLDRYIIQSGADRPRRTEISQFWLHANVVITGQLKSHRIAFAGFRDSPTWIRSLVLKSRFANFSVARWMLVPRDDAGHSKGIEEEHSNGTATASQAKARNKRSSSGMIWSVTDSREIKNRFVKITELTGREQQLYALKVCFADGWF